MTKRAPTPEELAELARRQRWGWLMFPILVAMPFLQDLLAGPRLLQDALGAILGLVVVGLTFMWVRAAAPDSKWWRKPDSFVEPDEPVG